MWVAWTVAIGLICLLAGLAIGWGLCSAVYRGLEDLAPTAEERALIDDAAARILGASGLQ